MMRGEKRKTGDAVTNTIDEIRPIIDNFSTKFLFQSVGRQLVTFTRILVTKYFSTPHGDQNVRSLECCSSSYHLSNNGTRILCAATANQCNRS